MTPRPPLPRRLALPFLILPRGPLAAAVLSAGLAACGGGGGGSASTPDATTPATPAPLTLTGVVARGAAQANATVNAKCATGTGTATTGSDGSYSLSVSSGALPCALQALTAAGALTSVATTTKANVTPFTELLVAQLTAQLPSTWYGSVATATLGTVATTATVSAAQTKVSSTLTSAGVDLTGVGDFVSGSLVAAAGSTTGNVYDKALDALQAKLVSSGTTLAQLTQTVANSAAGASGSGATGGFGEEVASSLPADLLLQPKASNCDSFRSGYYRVLELAERGSGAPAVVTNRAYIDATKLTAKDEDGSVSTLLPNGNCRYSDSDVDFVVHSSGVVVGRQYVSPGDTSYATRMQGVWHLFVAVPEQSIPLSELAGDANYMNWQFVDAALPWTVEAGSFTLDSAGKFSSYACNTTIASGTPTCVGSTPPPTLVADATFKAYRVGSSGSTYLWPFRDGGGRLLMVGTSDMGEPLFVTGKRTLTLPTVGATWLSNQFTADSKGTAADALLSTSHQILSVDTTKQSYQRKTTALPGTVSVPQVFVLNEGGVGYSHRSATTTTASDGSTAFVRETYLLPLLPGLTAYWQPNYSTTGNNSRFGVSVKAP